MKKMKILVRGSQRYRFWEGLKKVKYMKASGKEGG